MRIRSIKPEFWRSRHIAQIPWDLRLLFIGLWSYVDDNGVGIDDPWQIAADVFPVDPDPIEVRARVSEGLARLSRECREGSTVPFVLRYEVDGKRFLCITGWKHQRIDKPSRARYPLPPEGMLTSEDPELNTDPREGVARTPEKTPTGTGEQGNRGTEEQQTTTSSGARKRADRATRIPDDFTVTPDMVTWVRGECPNVDGRAETEKFIDYWRAEGGAKARKVDWEGTWRNWMRRERDRLPLRSPARASPGTNGTDANIAALLGRQTGTDATILQLPRGES